MNLIMYKMQEASPVVIQHESLSSTSGRKTSLEAYMCSNDDLLAHSIYYIRTIGSKGHP